MDEFIGVEDRGISEDLSFKFLILEQIRRINRLSSKEMRGGYYNETTSGSGNLLTTTKSYIPDAKEEYSNAVTTLAIMCLPYFDVIKKLKTKEEFEKLEEEIEELIKTKDPDYKVKKLNNRRKLHKILSMFLKEVNYFATIGIEQ